MQHVAEPKRGITIVPGGLTIKCEAALRLVRNNDTYDPLEADL